MSTDPVLYEKAGRVVTLTLNDPDRRNPVSGPEMIEALVGAIGRVQRDAEISVMILTGAGTAFSSGGDVKAMRDRGGMFGGPGQQLAEGYMYGIQQIPLAIYGLDVPTIAAVNGPAMGAGCDLAFMCDFRIASTGALFGEVFVSLGLIAGDAGSWFLPRRVPWEVAAEMTFTGRPIKAGEALDRGLCMKVVEPEALMDEARAFAGVIASKPPKTVRQAKRLLRAAIKMDLPSFLENAAVSQALCHQSEDHLEAVNALLEKRQGDYSGR
ncbi:MAG: enoyl-CoA hydratase [Rhodospirillaceae bacterium]|nr:enoyl-CoA hydratase [Rhodospirillaceae bacterium]MYF87733.1 enoyl-CoA hydratase [Rhodospirillaceae bacterium]MYH35390.1 enoyl-CoA hydratase [Rhodospirillaceae bacterium]MYK15136.1 enoyl-CoA hydratase [Rhodospirillaceae bacterium]MYK57119.1 enoyl-CoA hydratase [Rhodospirillaceae bacterium]